MIIKNSEKLLQQLQSGDVKFFINDEKTKVFIPDVPANLDFNKEDVINISGKSILTSKKFQESRVIKFADGEVLDFDELLLIAGPCSIKDEDSLMAVAKEIKNRGYKFFRAGAFKPRTSPHDFQGHEDEGLQILKRVKEAFGLKIVSEIMDASDISKFEGIVDIMQVGARNQQNFTLLKALGKTKTPVLLKRGLSSTMEEFILGGEYIVAHGNENVILCERGIRTYETKTRNTLDVSVVPVVLSETNLPIIVDPSHAVGKRDLVEAAALASVGAGALGLIIEADIDPLLTNTDIDQTVSLDTLDEIVKKAKLIKDVLK